MKDLEKRRDFLAVAFLFLVLVTGAYSYDFSSSDAITGNSLHIDTSSKNSYSLEDEGTLLPVYSSNGVFEFDLKGGSLQAEIEDPNKDNFVIKSLTFLDHPGDGRPKYPVGGYPEPPLHGPEPPGKPQNPGGSNPGGIVPSCECPIKMGDTLILTIQGQLPDGTVFQEQVLMTVMANLKGCPFIVTNEAACASNGCRVKLQGQSIFGPMLDMIVDAPCTLFS